MSFKAGPPQIRPEPQHEGGPEDIEREEKPKRKREWRIGPKPKEEAPKKEPPKFPNRKHFPSAAHDLNPRQKPYSYQRKPKRIQDAAEGTPHKTRDETTGEMTTEYRGAGKPKTITAGRGAPKTPAAYEHAKRKKEQDKKDKLAQAVATERARAAGEDKKLERSIEQRRRESEGLERRRFELGEHRKIRGGRSDDPEDTKKQPIKPQPKKRREANIDTEEEEVSREMNPFPEIASHRDIPLSEMQMSGQHGKKIGSKIRPHTTVEHGEKTEPNVMDEATGEITHRGGQKVPAWTEQKPDPMAKNPRWGKGEKETQADIDTAKETGKYGKRRIPERDKIVKRPARHALGHIDPDKYQAGEDEEITPGREISEYTGAGKLSGKKKKPRTSKILGEMRDDVPVKVRGRNALQTEIDTGETKRDWVPKFPMGSPKWDPNYRDPEEKKDEKKEEKTPKKGKKDAKRIRQRKQRDASGQKKGRKARAYTNAELIQEFNDLGLGDLNTSKKAEEGPGGMNMGAQRGLGHEAGNIQGSGESTQITEVKEEKEKSAYENHEQDESPDSQPNKQQIPPSKVGMDAIKTRLKLLKNKYTNIYKPLNL